MSEGLHRGRQATRAAAVVIALGALLSIVSVTSAFGLARGSFLAPCLSAHGTWQLRATAQGSGVSGVAINDLDPASCDGIPVHVTVLGNSAGDQSAAATTTLSTLDSRDDPCTGAPLAHARTIAGGSITLPSCPTGGPGRYASAQQATVFVISIGSTTEVLGEHFGQPPNSSGVPSATTTRSVSAATTSRSGASGQLPFTGSWAALLADLGLALVIIGSLIAYIGSRRRRRTS